VQYPDITEFENKFQQRIVKVIDFQNLVNVVIISLDEIKNKLEADSINVNTIFEKKTSTTVNFVLYNTCYKSMIFSTGDIPLQMAEPKKQV
jgi:hypothetical protein